MKKSIIQMGYVTDDYTRAIDFWVNQMGAGPFYEAEFVTDNQIYNGQPTSAVVSVAMGYSGDMQIEIVKQTNDVPSAYLEPFASGKPTPAGGFFHHVMLDHDGYDEVYDHFLQAGAKKCFDAVVPNVGRFCYLDTRLLMDCFVEMLEPAADFRAACDYMKKAHWEWEGSNPRRSYEDLMAELA